MIERVGNTDKRLEVARFASNDRPLSAATCYEIDIDTDTNGYHRNDERR